ncbi:MAG: histidine--tRNA ligase [Flammeovirgaceae bacterium]|nr:histidine--tRNA ligase [Flammeovirgaceae bacterium]
MEKPTLPKGTRDFGPLVMARRQYLFNTIGQVFHKFGFLPLQTPAMENLSTLTGKYGEEGDQLLFKILNSGDYLKDVDLSKLEARNSRLVASEIAEKGLRYDLTVPFARYVVMNRHEIALPFKRYQIQPVWRADRPQKGRYREFYQCDADVVGTDSLICEAEIVLMIKEVFQKLRLNDFTLKINHRSVLDGLAEIVNAGGKEADLYVAIDKLDKIGEEKVREGLIQKGFESKSLDALFEILNTKGSNEQKLNLLSNKFQQSEVGKKGVSDLKETLGYLKFLNANEQHVEVDIPLARGLSYYTGCIFEVKVNNVQMGSVSGGGRYDNLTQAFGSKEKLSGVGISFGIDRIYDCLDELNLFPKETATSSKVLVCHFDEASLQYGLNTLSQLRSAGIASEIYPDLAKFKKQVEYADKKKIPFVIIIGPEEVASGQLSLKNLESGEQSKQTIQQIIQALTP